MERSAGKLSVNVRVVIWDIGGAMTEHLYAHFQETDHMLEPSSQGSYHNGFRHLLYSPHFAS